MMAFEHFLTWRACEHGKARYMVIKSIDPDHPVTLHGGAPSALYSGSKGSHALDRGNDWFFADILLDIISGEKTSIIKKENSKECLLHVNAWRFRVLVEGEF